MQPLGNPVDKQVSDREFRQIAAGKRLVLGPQPLGDLADRRAPQEAAAIRTGKHRLDVARRQPARIHLHRQSLQLLGAAPHHFPNARAERLLPIGNLRRAVFDGALRARHPTPPVAVAIPGAGLGAAGVVIAPQRVSRFAFQRFLDDQPRRQPHQLRTLVRHLASAVHQRSQLLACPLGSRYPLHRGAPSSRPVAKPVLVGFAYQARVHPNPFSSKLTTSPSILIVSRFITEPQSDNCDKKQRIYWKKPKDDYVLCSK